MKYLKTYEGFFSKLKSKIFKKEDPIEKIDMVDFENTIDDCLVDLVDNGFDIKKESRPSNLYSTMKTYGNKEYAESTFGKERLVYYVTISKPYPELQDIDIHDIAGIISERPSFMLEEIKDVVLFTRDMVKDKFGIDMDFDMGMDALPIEEIKQFTIKFEIWNT